MWKLIFGFLFLTIVDGDGGGEPDGEADPEIDPDAEPEADPDAEPEADPDADPVDEPEDDKPENMAALRRARQEEATARQRLEVELAEERGRRQVLEQQHRPAPKDDGPGDDADEMTKWAHRTGKTVSSAQATANQALAISMDTADRAQFYTTTNPLIAKYKDEIESTLGRVRKEGGNASRELIFHNLVGRDAVKNAGKVKPGQSAAQKRVAEARKGPASVRSDAPTGGKQTNLQKLEKKLENQRI